MHCTWYTVHDILHIKGRKSSIVLSRVFSEQKLSQKIANKFCFFAKVIKCKKKNSAENICDVTVIFNCAKKLMKFSALRAQHWKFFYIIINNFSVVLFFEKFSSFFCEILWKKWKFSHFLEHRKCKEMQNFQTRIHILLNILSTRKNTIKICAKKLHC